MKKLNLKLAGSLVFTILTASTFAQDWRVGGNTNFQLGGVPPILGTIGNFPLRIITSNIERARFTTGAPLNSWNGNFGDGLRIFGAGGSNAHLDLFTSNNSGGNETHARFGDSGQISGQNNRFEFISTGAALGNYYSVFRVGGIHRFDRGQTEYGRLGTNNHWRFGQNTSGPVFGGLDAGRMVEVVDNVAQFRLTFSPNANGPFTDFFSNANGNLQIQPQNGSVGINANVDPTATLDVFGNVRIRNVPAAVPNSLIVGVNAGGPGDINVRRLDFTGNANQVLLGDGTWGTATTNPTANNGIFINGGDIQLGAPCNNLTGLFATQFTESRTVLIRNNDFWMASFNNETGGVGFGGQPASVPFCGTGNTVEISANNKNVKYGNTDASGLRFTKLTSSSPTIANGVNGVDNSKVLSVDEDGDVVYVDAPIGGGSVGNFCSQPQNPLSDNYEIPLNGFNYYFDGQGVGVNNVGIGVPCPSPILFAKLLVVQSVTNPLINPGISIAGQFLNNAPAGVTSFGVASFNQSNSTSTNVAGFFQTSGISVSATNIGVYGEATGGNVNYAGFFDGDVIVNGAINPSDINLKKNITTIANANNIISQLSPVSYEYDAANNPDFHLSEGLKYGFIAQDVEQILPSLVTDNLKPAQYDSLGNQISSEVQFKGLEYNNFIALLTKGMQEQNMTIDSLKSELAQKDSLINDVNDRLTQLENCLSNLLPLLCQINNTAIQENDEETQKALLHQINVELFDGENIILEQNIPNPFAERTVINYQIPSSVRDAKLLFYNNQGRMIREVKITERGAGQINVFGAELSKGTYSYTLICDGEVISTKKMVKQ